MPRAQVQNAGSKTSKHERFEKFEGFERFERQRLLKPLKPFEPFKPGHAEVHEDAAIAHGCIRHAPAGSVGARNHVDAEHCRIIKEHIRGARGTPRPEMVQAIGLPHIIYARTCQIQGLVWFNQTILSCGISVS